MKEEFEDEFEDVSYLHWSTELVILLACLGILTLETIGLVYLF